jgi:uncharacterized protein YqgC (DUF456 family)
MEIALVIFGFILLILGVLGAVLPVLPGPSLSFLGLLLIKWSGFSSFSSAFLWVWAGITVAITILDYILPPLMTKKFGGSRYAAVGSFLGLIAGLFFFPPWGMILGPFFGALIGELIHNRNDSTGAFKAAMGAFLAFAVSTGAKLVISTIMLFYAVRTVLRAFF